MHTYRIDLAVPSGFITPWQADTLFGHFCWAAERHDGFRHFQGASGLIDLFRTGDPPFILSNGFPAGLLPAPITLRRLYQPETHDEIDCKRYDLLKRAKKREYLSIEQFKVFQKGGIPELESDRKGFIPSTTLHNQINRLSNTTGNQGSLFELDEQFAPHGKVQIYAKVTAGFEDDLRRLLELVAREGYGSKKSTGKGACVLEGFQPFNGFDLPGRTNIPDGAMSGFVTLSHFVPAQDDPTDGAYKMTIKYGKLGEEKTYCGQPFKKPLIMLKPGAVFRTSQVKPFYGRLVENVAYADSSVVQYGFAFPVPVRTA
jgi:CRISPR-associated protein Csm4